MRKLIMLLLCVSLSVPEALAQDSAPVASTESNSKTLVVGTKLAPPFAFKDEKGEWVGITIELWDGIAKSLGIEYTIKEYPLAGLLNSVAAGEVDVGASALTVTAERAERMAFSPTYYGSGLGIATSLKKRDVWSSLASKLFTWTFLKALLALITVLLAAGFGIWVFERKKNPEQFGGRPQHGLGNGFWWSAVTMTTVGYGDKAPVTMGGRVIGLIWMFTSVIIISGFTGAIATALTVGQLEPAVTGPRDLPNAIVGTLDKSSAQEYLKVKGIRPRAYPTVKDGLDAVASGKIQAFVNDRPILVYETAQHHPSEVDVLEHSFDPGYLALAYPLEGFDHRDIDLALLEFIQSPAWDAILTKYTQEQK